MLDSYLVPLSVVTDGADAEILDTVSGDVVGQGLAAIPSKEEAIEQIQKTALQPFPPERLARERIIFRSYDEMNINVQRKLKRG